MLPPLQHRLMLQQPWVHHSLHPLPWRRLSDSPDHAVHRGFELVQRLEEVGSDRGDEVSDLELIVACGLVGAARPLLFVRRAPLTATAQVNNRSRSEGQYFRVWFQSE